MKKSLLKSIPLSIAFGLMFSVMYIPSNVQASSTTTRPVITYRAHVQDYSWDNAYKKAGDENQLNISNPSSDNYAGTTGKAKQMEALQISVKAPEGVELNYRAHVQDYGWMGWVAAENSDNVTSLTYAGTTGEAKRIEGIQIVVTGLEGYQVKYRAHVQDYGWMNWVSAENSLNASTLKNQFAGTTGEAKQMEALQIIIVPVGESSNPGTTTSGLQYRAHIEDYGWENTLKPAGNESELNVSTPTSNNFVGTTGKAKQMEALEINAPVGLTLKYRAHVQDIGWMDWVTADNKVGTAFAGTTGKAKPMEAIQIVVENLENYELKYRTHVEDIGWMDWVTAETSVNSNTLNFAGTTGRAKQIEALEIIIVPINNNDNPDPENPEEHTQHKFSEWQTTIPATCLKKGERVRTCTICGEKETEVINECGSTLVSDPSKDSPATCTTWGYNNYRKCTVCGNVYGLVPPLGHTYSNEYTTDKEPTCTEEGQRSIHCTREGCNDIKPGSKTILEPTGHIWSEEHHSEQTCTQPKMTYRVCTKCNAQNVLSTESPALGHSFTNYIYNNDETCTKDGTETSTCDRCSETSTRVKENSKQHKLEIQNDAIAATCIKEGKTASKKCTRCSYVEEGKTIPSNGHHSITKTITEITCTGATVEEKCTECEYTNTYKDTYSYGKGHTWILNPKGDQVNDYICSDCNLEHHIGKSGYIWRFSFVVDTFMAKNSQSKWITTLRSNVSDFYQKAPEPRDGYKFVGWYVYENGQKQKVDNTKLSDDGLTLHVTWRDSDKTFEPCYAPIN